MRLENFCGMGVRKKWPLIVNDRFKYFNLSDSETRYLNFDSKSIEVYSHWSICLQLNCFGNSLPQNLTKDGNLDDAYLRYWMTVYEYRVSQQPLSEAVLSYYSLDSTNLSETQNNVFEHVFWTMSTIICYGFYVIILSYFVKLSCLTWHRLPVRTLAWSRPIDIYNLTWVISLGVDVRMVPLWR